MTTLIHHLNSVRQRPFNESPIELAKKRIEIISLKNLETQFVEKDDKIRLMNQINKMYNDPKFLQLYSQAIVEEINNAFGTQFKERKDATEAMFSENANLILSSLQGGLENSLQNFDDLINRLRSAFSYLLPSSAFNCSNLAFFDYLRKAFHESGEASLQELEQNCLSMQKRYSELIRGKITEENFQKWLRKTNGAGFKIIGTGLWERIVLQARKNATKKFVDIDEEINRLFKNSGAIVVGGKQTGSQKNEKGQEKVTDSFINIVFMSDEGQVIAKINVGDSTKIRQGKWYRSGKNTSFHIKEQLFGQKLLELSPNLYLYWMEHFQSYLYYDNHILKKSRKANLEDLENNYLNNWKQTIDGLKLLSGFEAIAIRSGGLAITLSINEKIITLDALTNLLIEDNLSSILMTGLPQDNLKNMGYVSYVKTQTKKSTETELQQRASNFWDKIMNKKFNITVKIIANMLK